MSQFSSSHRYSPTLSDWRANSIKMQSKGRDKLTPIDSLWNWSVGLNARTRLLLPQLTDSLTHGGHR
jgi:hypothetical protein